METRFVPDAPGAWLLYDLGEVVLAVPPELRAAAEAVAATGRSDVATVLSALPEAGAAQNAPFAVLQADASAFRVVLRGPATVTAGAQTRTGLGADPWLDATIPDVAVARLTVPGGEWMFDLGARRASRADTNVVVPASPSPASAPTPIAPPPPLGASELEPHVEITEVPDVSARIPAVAPAAAPDDDHTVVVEELAQLRATRGLADPAPLRSAAPPTPPVAVLSLELPDGTLTPLDAVVLVGRAPVAPADGSARLVRLADGDISRNHARVAVEGGTVVVTDLGSRNGTSVRIPGRPPQKLRGGEPTPVLVDTVIDFGGGVELRVREG